MARSVHTPCQELSCRTHPRRRCRSRFQVHLFRHTGYECFQPCQYMQLYKMAAPGKSVPERSSYAYQGYSEDGVQCPQGCKVQVYTHGYSHNDANVVAVWRSGPHRVLHSRSRAFHSNSRPQPEKVPQSSLATSLLRLRTSYIREYCSRQQSQHDPSSQYSKSDRVE